MEIQAKYYLVHEGDVTEINHDALNAYPYLYTDEPDDATDADRRIFDALVEGSAVVAYAEDASAALALADQYDAGKIQPGNVYCAPCGHAHGALSARS